MSAQPENWAPVASWEKILAKVTLLHQQGCAERSGWNLPQTLSHLADWLSFPLEGYPHQPFHVRAILFVVRMTVARQMLAKVLISGVMPPASPTLPQTVYPEDANPQLAFERFCDAVQAFCRWTEAYQPSPVFGRLTREQVDRLQRIHCVHHLIPFVMVPKSQCPTCYPQIDLDLAEPSS